MRENCSIEHFSNRQVLFVITLMEPAAKNWVNFLFLWINQCIILSCLHSPVYFRIFINNILGFVKMFHVYTNLPCFSYCLLNDQWAILVYKENHIIKNISSHNLLLTSTNKLKSFSRLISCRLQQTEIKWRFRSRNLYARIFDRSS